MGGKELRLQLSRKVSTFTECDNGGISPQLKLAHFLRLFPKDWHGFSSELILRWPTNWKLCLLGFLVMEWSPTRKFPSKWGINGKVSQNARVLNNLSWCQKKSIILSSKFLLGLCLRIGAAIGLWLYWIPFLPQPHVTFRDDFGSLSRACERKLRYYLNYSLPFLCSALLFLHG